MKVLISGYLGSGNVGDEALFAGLARGLRARGHAPAALSARPAATRATHGVPAFGRVMGAPVAILRHDAVVSGGGGLLQDVTSARSLRYYLSVIRLARRLGRRTVVFGQSVGPLSESGRTRVTTALRGLPIGVRDRASLDALASMDLRGELVADPALTLPPPAGRRGRGLLVIPRADVPGSFEALVAVAREARDVGEDVRILALQTGRDQGAAHRLAGEVPGSELLRDATPEGVLERCAEAAFVVSARLHGLILATLAGRGHVGVSYDPKVDGFLRESGGDGVSVPVDPDALRTAVRARRPLDPARRTALLDLAERGLDWLDTVLRDAVPAESDLIRTG